MACGAVRAGARAIGRNVIERGRYGQDPGIPKPNGTWSGAIPNPQRLIRVYVREQRRWRAPPPPPLLLARGRTCAVAAEQDDSGHVRLQQDGTVDRVFLIGKNLSEVRLRAAALL